jgi:molecular chaperone GrpE
MGHFVLTPSDISYYFIDTSSGPIGSQLGGTMSSKQQETPCVAPHAEPESSLFAAEAAGRGDKKDSPEAAPPAQESDSAESAAPRDASAERIAALEQELAAVREELSVVNDKYLRKLADDANFRKRMAREKEDGQRFALSTLLGDLIPVLDDFDRAIASAETQKDYGILHDGVALIKRRLGSILETKYGLSRFESLDKPFDPNRHEAVAMVQGGPEDGEEAVVAEEFLPGYGLHDRVLRTAKVRVRMPAPRDQAADAQGGAADASGDAPEDKDAN